ncbi:hypothetical protein J2T10_002728 [Paenarthrobacter nicotinovorans]|jgi:hypothetical protein|uniref:Uncharacterized protein n=1 Tax=Paenarthrobacter nicotinovorans TaxID=29320 RepID=A0ABT9TN48_PAENI|nr:hypothetical protein [Paenarthrobacter nicotinovorans]GAT88400.1 hypothetical protein CVCC1112_3059 [Paenarthrobacter nicotinovorans]
MGGFSDDLIIDRNTGTSKFLRKCAICQGRSSRSNKTEVVTEIVLDNVSNA